MIDANAHAHVFVEKIPVVTTAYLDFASHLPQAGFIACVVVGGTGRHDGRPHVLIDTQTPWGIESTTGRTQFEVLSEQLCELPNEVEGG
jgi:hypothetical protein